MLISVSDLMSGFKETSHAQIMSDEQREKDLLSNVKVRSLALRFMAVTPGCFRAIPCTKYEEKSSKYSLTMYLYANIDGKGIPKDLKTAAEQMFHEYQIEFVDLQRRPLCNVVTQLPPSEKRCDKKLRKLAKTIEKNLHIFKNRLNVTAVQASYRVEGSTVTDIPCVTVYVLGKGKIPAGETDFLKMPELDGYPFDVVEGYFLPCGDPKSYAFPLQGGVGIGVKNETDSVGTLGGFLEDEDGKRYILSCQHVLCPNGKSDSPSHAIVQPAELDYQIEVAKILSQVQEWGSRLKKQKEKLDNVPDDERQRYENRVKKTKGDLETLNEHWKKVERSKPRIVGKYCCGLKENESVAYHGNTSRIYVDAAVAELENEESQELIDDKDEQSEDDRCPVFGFKKDIDSSFAPTGDIVDLKEFDKQDLAELRFMKSGRTTGKTDGGQLETQNFFANLSGYPEKFCAGDLSNVPFKLFCGRCKPPTNANKVDLSCFKQLIPCCFECKSEIKGESEVNSIWAYNSLAIRMRKKPFCEEGDSGALVFDDRGRAWGMIFGVFTAEGINFDFGLASPLSVTLQALEKRLGKKLQLWCTRE